MVYKDENHINIINIYKLFLDIDKIDIYNYAIWVEIQDAMLVNEYNKDNISLVIQRYNDIKIVCPIHYSSIKKIYEPFKLITISGYEIVKIY